MSTLVGILGMGLILLSLLTFIRIRGRENKKVLSEARVEQSKNKDRLDLAAVGGRSIAGAFEFFIGILALSFAVTKNLTHSSTHHVLAIGIDIFLIVLVVGFVVVPLWQIVRGSETPVKFSIFASLSLIFLSVIFFLPALVDLIFKEKRSDLETDSLGAIFGIVIVVTSGLITSVAQLKEFSQILLRDLGKKLDNVKRFTDFNDHFQDPWSHQVLADINTMFGEVADDRDVHLRMALRYEFKAQVAEWRSFIHGSKWRVSYPFGKEKDRMDRLEAVICHAKVSVDALTYDDGIYLKGFWGSQKTKKYFDANAKTDANVRRILVVDKKVIDGTGDPADIEKRIIIDDIVSHHQAKRQHLFIIAKEDAILAPDTRSFLICDEEVLSESYLPHQVYVKGMNEDQRKQFGEDSKDGYISYNQNKARIRDLRNHFDLLLRNPEKLETDQTWKTTHSLLSKKGRAVADQENSAEGNLNSNQITDAEEGNDRPPSTE